MSKLRRDIEENQKPVRAKPKIVFPRYVIYVRCVTAPPSHPEWLDKEWLRSDDPLRLLDHNSSCLAGQEEYLRDAWLNAAQRIARKIMAAEGGVWIGRVRDASHDPFPDRPITREQMDGMNQHELAGPDGPAKRFLLKYQGRPNRSTTAALAESLKTVPKIEKPVTVASRASLDALQDQKGQIEAVRASQGHNLPRSRDVCQLPPAKNEYDGNPIRADEDFWNQADDLPRKEETLCKEIDDDRENGS